VSLARRTRAVYYERGKLKFMMILGDCDYEHNSSGRDAETGHHVFRDPFRLSTGTFRGLITSWRPLLALGEDEKLASSVAGMNLSKKTAVEVLFSGNTGQETRFFSSRLPVPPLLILFFGTIVDGPRSSDHVLDLTVISCPGAFRSSSIPNFLPDRGPQTVCPATTKNIKTFGRNKPKPS